METKKHFSLRKAVLLCAAVIAVFAMAGVCYAEDVGGIQRTIQLWRYGDQTDAVLEIQDGHYELTYEDADGVHSEGGGGVAIDAFGRERPLTEEELLEDLQDRIDVTYREDGTVWVYYKDQSMEITDLFDENGVCFVQLKNGKKTVYLTVEYDNGFSWSTECYLQPTQRHSSLQKFLCCRRSRGIFYSRSFTSMGVNMGLPKRVTKRWHFTRNA